MTFDEMDEKIMHMDLISFNNQNHIEILVLSYMSLSDAFYKKVLRPK